ncbi:hypothetical protein [Candidatus Hodgkinia cicadicola]|uniref:hypothetical protein n=1 Tax=Candidatus Hodgkinia cicadicola TaxID=573658 RepID=UPI001788DDB4
MTVWTKTWTDISLNYPNTIDNNTDISEYTSFEQRANTFSMPLIVLNRFKKVR